MAWTSNRLGWTSTPNEDLVARHQHLIAPLLKNRALFAESTHFLLYDFWLDNGTVDENVFAYSNRHGHDRAVILYNNSYQSTHGTIHFSVGFLEKASGSMQQKSLAFGLDLPDDDSIVIAYMDNVLGLEYLHRAKDLRESWLDPRSPRLSTCRAAQVARASVDRRAAVGSSLRCTPWFRGV